MESVSLKLEKNFARAMEETMKEFHYSTKTEFIRDSIRTKIEQLKEKKVRQEGMKELLTLRGKLKGKASEMNEKEFYDWRKKTGEELLKKYEAGFKN